jgi:BirA family biotin operon repressor/biotin-[acetyl-CoA-carboxylase] ligase
VTASAEIARSLTHQQFESGESIARRLGISRAAVWKGIGRLRSMGLGVHAVRGRGYRLAYPFVPLDPVQIADHLGRDEATPGLRIEVSQQVTSTHELVVDAARAGTRGPLLHVAEAQSSGRGRRGRRWESPYGANLYLSLLWSSEALVTPPGVLSLASALAVASVLEEVGADVSVKWPNDLMHRGRKLAGVLLEVVAESGGPCRLVVGVGLNVNMKGAVPTDYIGQPWTDLSTACARTVLDRNRLAARITTELLRSLTLCAADGFDPLLPQWNRLDATRDREVRLMLGDGRRVAGVARGVDRTGRLLVECGGQVEAHVSGELSLRLVD